MMAGYYSIPSLIAGTDLSDHQFKMVRMSAAENREVLKITNANTQRPLGVLQNDPDDGEPANIATFGVCKAEAGGTITRGAKLACNNAGEVISDVEVTTGTAVDLHHFGVAIESAVDGDIIDIYVFPAELIGSE